MSCLLMSLALKLYIFSFAQRLARLPRHPRSVPERRHSEGDADANGLIQVLKDNLEDLQGAVRRFHVVSMSFIRPSLRPSRFHFVDPRASNVNRDIVNV